MCISSLFLDERFAVRHNPSMPSHGTGWRQRPWESIIARRRRCSPSGVPFHYVMSLPCCSMNKRQNVSPCNLVKSGSITSIPKVVDTDARLRQSKEPSPVLSNCCAVRDTRGDFVIDAGTDSAPQPLVLTSVSKRCWADDDVWSNDALECAIVCTRSLNSLLKDIDTVERTHMPKVV